MGRVSRKFRVDSASGKLVEYTSLEDKLILDKIEAQTSLYRRDLFAEDSVPSKSTRTIARWPIVSTSAGIDPEDVPAEQGILAQHGVKTEYTPDGDPIFRDRSHRKAHCEALNIRDRDGGYGDST